MNRHNFVVASVEESNLIDDIVADGRSTEGFACLYIPNDKSVVVLTSD